MCARIGPRTSLRSHRFTYHFWHVLTAEEDVKGHQLRDQRAAAVSRVSDSVKSCREVGAGCVHGNRYRRLPALQQWLQIIQERIIGVRGIRNTLPAFDGHAHRHIVVQYPVVTALCSSRFGRFLVARHSVLQTHRFARDAHRAVLYLETRKRLVLIEMKLPSTAEIPFKLLPKYSLLYLVLRYISSSFYIVLHRMFLLYDLISYEMNSF